MGQEESIAVRSRVVIEHDDGQWEQYICPCTDCEGKHDHKVYSYKHAKSLGWKFTTQEEFSQDGMLVGVCQSCVERFQKQPEVSQQREVTT